MVSAAVSRVPSKRVTFPASGNEIFPKEGLNCSIVIIIIIKKRIRRKKDFKTGEKKKRKKKKKKGEKNFPCLSLSDVSVKRGGFVIGEPMIVLLDFSVRVSVNFLVRDVHVFKVFEDFFEGIQNNFCVWDVVHFEVFPIRFIPCIP